MTGTRAVIAAVGVALVLGVAACSGSDPEPRIAPPSSSAPSSPSTSPAAAESPEEQQSAFVDDYFSTVSKALSAGDPSRFLGMSAANCVNCRRLAANVRKAYAHGGHVEGARWTVQKTEFVREAPLGFIWTVDVQTNRERWYGGDGEIVKIVRASVQHFGVALEKDGDSWQVRELKVSS